MTERRSFVATDAEATELPPDDEAEGGESLTDSELAGHMAALLFAADEPLAVGELARLLEVRRSVVERVSRLLVDAPPTGLLVQRHGDRLQLVSGPASARYIRRLRGLEEQARLSRAALEVLAVVAYRQPVTRAEIEAIRGVNGDRALASLLTRGLIEEVGRRETVGRPVLFGTTLDFLEHLGLRSLKDLPPLPAAETAVVVGEELASDRSEAGSGASADDGLPAATTVGDGQR